MRVNNETIGAIAVVIGLFLMAMFCMACSLNPREILDCSLFRCCCPWRRRRRENDQEGVEQQVYTSMEDFVIESEDEERPGLVNIESNNNGEPTQQTLTMQAIFPDLLGEEKKDNSGENPDEGNLNEPLL